MIAPTPELDRQAAAFLAAVIEAPDDDGPRLMYADWLIERGDVRGDFIRTRVELERLPDCGHDWATLPGGFSCPTCRRKDELYAATVNEDGFPPWEHAMQGWARPFKLSEVTFRRGFVEAVSCSALAWLRHGAAILAATPLREVTLSDYLIVGVDAVALDAEGVDKCWDARARIWPLALYTRSPNDYVLCSLDSLSAWDGTPKALLDAGREGTNRRGPPVRLDVAGDALTLPCRRGSVRFVLEEPPRLPPE